MIYISSAIADLRANWHTLPDHERAQAISPIVSAGVSRRQVAKALDVSEGTIRILLQLLDADPVDLEAFRLGRISRNELIRRVNGTSARQESKSSGVSDCGISRSFRQSIEIACYPRISDAAEGSEAILSWLHEDGVRDAYASEILEEAYAALVGAEEKGTLPRDRAPSRLSAEEIIRACRPNPANFEMEVAWLAHWLSLWVFHLIPSAAVRRDALGMAIEQVAEEIAPRSFGGFRRVA